MHSPSHPVRSAFLKSLCAFMLSFTLAVSPAFALPKSPFLGANDDSAPNIHLLQRSEFHSEGSLHLLPSPNLQYSASNVGLYGLTDVSLFHGPPIPSELIYIVVAPIVLLPVVGLALAIGGHAGGNDDVRNAGNIMLYPSTLAPPVLNCVIGDHHYYSLSNLALVTGLVLATVGQASDHHSLRNAGNWTYLGGLVFSIVSFLW